MKTASSKLLVGFIVSGAALLLAWWWTTRYMPSDNAQFVPSISQAAQFATTTTPSPDSGRSVTRMLVPAVPVAQHTAATPSFTAALANLSSADAAYVKSVNTRLFGALDYRSFAEQQWKLERGFPTIEQVIALRGQPPPQKLTDVQLAKLNFDELKKYLVAWTLAQPNADELAEQFPGGAGARDTFLFNASSLLNRDVDTPFPAYVRASLVPPNRYQDELYSNALVHAAMQAAQKGDAELGDAIRERLRLTNPDAAGVISLIWAYGTEHAATQVQPCRADRYTGNPRTVEANRRHNAQAMLNGACSK